MLAGFAELVRGHRCMRTSFPPWAMLLLRNRPQSPFLLGSSAIFDNEIGVSGHQGDKCARRWREIAPRWSTVDDGRFPSEAVSDTRQSCGGCYSMHCSKESDGCVGMDALLLGLGRAGLGHCFVKNLDVSDELALRRWQPLEIME